MVELVRYIYDEYCTNIIHFSTHRKNIQYIYTTLYIYNIILLYTYMYTIYSIYIELRLVVGISYMEYITYTYHMYTYEIV